MSTLSKYMGINIDNINRIFGISKVNIGKIIGMGIPAAGGDKGIFGGGASPGYENIDYIIISTPGDATFFGNLTTARAWLSATSNGTNGRGVFGGGSLDTNIIDYVTITSAGDATDFGDLSLIRHGLAATSNGTAGRGVFGGGSQANAVNVIDYITISSTGNAADFGDLDKTTRYLSATSNGTTDRGVFGGGYDSNEAPSLLNIISYITISSTGNATDFGDLTAARWALTATSNGVTDRGIFAGGVSGVSSPNTNVIDYITISSTGNATDFGDLTAVRRSPAATSNGVNDRGVFAGHYDGSGINVMDYITISSTGNAIDFGDLPTARGTAAGTSNF